MNNCLDEALNNLNNISEEYLVEMALSRKDAIIRCSGLGEKFVEHFNKIYNANSDDENISHWKTELSSYWGQVKDIKLKPSSKLLSLENLMDWFFTAGQNSEDFFTSKDVNAESSEYESLILHLIKNRTMEAEEAINSFDWK